jgi:hypothetical protein
MALSTATVSFDAHQILGSDFDSRRTKCRVYTNVVNQTLIDTSTGETRMGDETVTVGSDGTGTFTTWIPGADGNPISWQTYVAFDYPRTGARDRTTRVFGPYTITGTSKTISNKALTSNVATLTTSTAHGLDVGNTVTVAGVDATFNGTFTLTAVTATTLSYAKTATNVTSVAATGTLTSPNVKLALLEEEQAVPPEYETAVTARLDAHAAELEADLDAAVGDLSGYVTDAETAKTGAEDARDLAEQYRDEAHDISGISTSDGVVEALINDSGSDTSAALSASTAEGIDNEASPIGQAGRRQYRAKGQTLRPLDFDGANEREALQACIDYTIANGYKSITFDEMIDLTGLGLPYRTVHLYGSGGSGLTSFTLTFGGQTTSSIGSTASASDVQTALEALSNIGNGEAAVTRTGAGSGADPYRYTIKFQGTLANTMTTLTATPTGGTGTVTISTGAVSIDKTNWYDRDGIVLEGAGGGIAKSDNGRVFTSRVPNTGDVIARGLKLVSTPGGGTVLWDADKLLRINSLACEFYDWDRVLQQIAVGRWSQSMRFKQDKILGGQGAAFLVREAYDTTFDDILCEDREAFWWNSDGTMTTIANRNWSLHDSIIENITGAPIKLAHTWSGQISMTYFEIAGGATDSIIDLWSLAQSTRQTGLALKENLFVQSAAQISNRVGAVLVGANATDAPVLAEGNVQEAGIMFKFAHSTGMVEDRGNRVENSGLIAYPGQEHQTYKTGGRAGTTAARPKNPRINLDTYVDTDLGKLIIPTAAGVKAQASLRFTAGATSSGNITITIAGVAYVVAVTAGDTLTQVRDKVVAAGASTFWPTWAPFPSSTNVVGFSALQYGPLSPATMSFSDTGGTGVTSDFASIGTQGVNPTWNEMARILSAQATLDFPSIAAGGEQELTVTVTGAAFGDGIALAPPALDHGLSVSAYVSAANTVKIRLVNSTGSAIDPASAAWTVKILK